MTEDELASMRRMERVNSYLIKEVTRLQEYLLLAKLEIQQGQADREGLADKVRSMSGTIAMLQSTLPGEAPP